MSKTVEQLAAQTKNCTAACWDMPECLTCGQIKKPVGRDAAAGSSYCGHDCPDYRNDPKPGHYWSGEEPFNE